MREVLNPFNITLQGEIWWYQKIAVPLQRSFEERQSQVLKLLPLQGDRVASVITQGDALG